MTLRTLARAARFRLIAACICTLVGTAVSAQTAVNGPYYATPSWDQTLPSTTRFLVLANYNGEAVLDRETGLVWERTPSDQPSVYNTAFEGCTTARLGNRYGWRLPTIAEIGSLLDSTDDSRPLLPAGHPFSVPRFGTFWTTTAGANILSDSGRYVQGYAPRRVSGSETYVFASGLVPEHLVSYARWCVRGPGDPGSTR